MEVPPPDAFDVSTNIPEDYPPGFFGSKATALPMLSYQDWENEGLLVLKGALCGTLRKSEDKMYLESEPTFRWSRFSFTCSFISDEELAPLYSNTLYGDGRRSDPEEVSSMAPTVLKRRWIGDLLTLLEGSKIPVALRHVQETKYKLVGPAIMGSDTLANFLGYDTREGSTSSRSIPLTMTFILV